MHNSTSQYGNGQSSGYSERAGARRKERGAKLVHGILSLQTEWFSPSKALLIVDGTMKTYEYNGNTVAMLQWLEGKLPQDIHEPSPINRAELCDPNSDQTIVIAMKEAPLQLPQFAQYSDFSQGISPMQ